MPGQHPKELLVKDMRSDKSLSDTSTRAETGKKQGERINRMIEEAARERAKKGQPSDNERLQQIKQDLDLRIKYPTFFKTISEIHKNMQKGNGYQKAFNQVIIDSDISDDKKYNDNYINPHEFIKQKQAIAERYIEAAKSDKPIWPLESRLAQKVIHDLLVDPLKMETYDEKTKKIHERTALLVYPQTDFQAPPPDTHPEATFSQQANHPDSADSALKPALTDKIDNNTEKQIFEVDSEKRIRVRDAFENDDCSPQITNFLVNWFLIPSTGRSSIERPHRITPNQYDAVKKELTNRVKSGQIDDQQRTDARKFANLAFNRKTPFRI